MEIIFLSRDLNILTIYKSGSYWQIRRSIMEISPYSTPFLSLMLFLYK